MSSPFSTIYDTVQTRVEALGADIEVTHYELTLGDANATTGIPAQTYSEGTAIDMIILSKAATQILTGTGLYVKRDALGLTKTAVAEGDRIKDADDNYYTVTSVLPQPVGDVMAYYQADLIYNPML
jgi:hypothetical protein